MTGELIRKGLKSPQRVPKYFYLKVKLLFLQYYHRIKLGTKIFKFRGQNYSYFSHRYNKTWNNERAIEVPIVWGIVKNCKGRVLEIGNVLSHYYPVTHTIVDKYEKAKGVINQDVVDFRPFRYYDLVVSISTMEHVGWDEKPRKQNKILYALENLKSNCLKPGGKMVITLPFGYNRELDNLLNEGKINLGKQYYLKRVSKYEWVEVGWGDVRNVKYNTPFANANGIVVGMFEKQ